MSDQELQQRMPEYFLGEFVKNAFTVSSDGAVQKQKKNKAFAMTRGKASEWLRSYYDRNDPYKTAKKDTVTVEINYVYPNPNISNFYTVGWTTTEMEAKTGEIVKIQKYVGEFHFEWGTHKDESVINNYNPMGFFIEDVSVSKDNSKKVFNN
jgi:type IV secretory pathway TrbF-like protein